jgi:hypothetical protein
MKQTFIALSLALISNYALAQQSCTDYPFDEGMDVQNVDEGTKIMATAQVAVSIDDIDSIKDAREEATIEAKAIVAKFLTEDIQSDSAINKVVNESKESDGQSVKVARSELVTRVKSLRNSSQALLRGVVVLGSCYTKGREFRVTVGLKPETIKSAESIAGSINKSLSNQSTPQSSGRSGNTTNNQNQGNSGSTQPLRGMDGHSNFEKINKF